VVFTDLIGSTELMARLGDADFNALRGEHFARHREAIAACWGEKSRTPATG
jgi:class 3 adenylate cyclase